jgi:hypothetical protein
MHAMKCSGFFYAIRTAERIWWNKLASDGKRLIERKTF